MKSKIHQILHDAAAHPFISLFSILSGLSLGGLIYIYHFQIPLFSKSRILICMLVALFAAVLVDIFLTKITLPIFRSKNRGLRAAILVVTILVSVLLSFSFSFTIPHIYPLYPKHTLSVAFDLQDIPLESDGIYFSHLQLAFRDVSYAELDLQGDYQVNENTIFFPAGQSAGFTWQGITGEEAALYFQSTAVSFPITITWDGQSRSVNLASASDITKFAQPFIALPHENTIVKIAAFPIILLMLFILLTGLFNPHPYAYILLLVWLFIFLIFYPGIIGDVSILAVNELQQGHPTDWHPIIFTLLLSFCMRYFASAASMLILQIVALALLAGSVFSFLNRRGIPNKILLPITLLMALLPTNFLALITLTNDIPYSITLMGLTFLAFKIVLSKGAWLQSKTNLLLLTLTASLSILLRYNGIPAVGFFFICLLIIYPKFWRSSLFSLLIVGGVWFFVSGPFSTWLNVTHDSQGHFDNILLHHISAHVINGTPMTDEQSAYLDSLLPLEEWKYSCCSNTAMWANDDFDRDTFHANSTFNRQLELSLLQRDPGLEISHMLCASDIVWNVAGGCEIKHPFVEEIRGNFYWTRSYQPEYLEASFLPGLVEPLSHLLLWLDNNALAADLLWHPAWYFYAAILCAIIFSLKVRSWRALLVLTPALGQSLFLLLFNRVQNFRYQYCIVLVGFLLIAIAFYQPDREVKNGRRSQ